MLAPAAKMGKKMLFSEVFTKRIKTFVPTGLNPLYLYLIKQMELTRNDPSLQSYLSWTLSIQAAP